MKFDDPAFPFIPWAYPLSDPRKEKINAQTFSHAWELPARLTGEGGRRGDGIPADARDKPGSGGQLIAWVPSLDLVVTRQTGSHVRLTTQQKGEHHVTIPRHDSLRVGTLSAVLREVSEHLGISRDQLVKELF
ncbi:MAG: type II toxin-antitoxin system HicA family toxin [Verrucomicrobia bacterium]|nr:type II toxin-antitoxin system HicA family toxin [Verrucomicrobiota bacterium]